MKIVNQLILASTIFWTQYATADFDPDVVSKNLINVQITNSISGDDLRRLERFREGVGKLKEITKEPVLVTFELNSDGGDVHAAMAMGRVIRGIESMVIVRPKASCASACVFLLAGGARRVLEGGARIGIHRPYMVDAVDTTPALEKAKYEKLAKDVRTFLSEMNVNQKLFDDMMVIPPHEIKTLTSSELQAYGLDQDDPFVQESDAMAKAKRLGITRAQLAVRQSSVFRICGGRPDVSNNEAVVRRMECQERVLRSGK